MTEIQLQIWAAERGDPIARLLVGLMYYEGDGVPQNYAKAREWLTKAAEHGDDVATTVLGVMHQRGEGVPRDYVQAYTWFNLAAAAGNQVAAETLDKLQRKMTPQQVAEAQKLSSQWAVSHKR